MSGGQINVPNDQVLGKFFFSKVRRKVNLLNVSTTLQKTIRTILEQLKKEGIKYKITEEAIQVKILKNYEDIDWLTVN